MFVNKQFLGNSWSNLVDENFGIVRENQVIVI